MDKRKLLTQVVEFLLKNLTIAEQARDAAQREANSHVGAMESRYDTWKEENQYEVSAQELRIRDYQDSIERIRLLIESDKALESNGKVKIGSVVVLESEQGAVKYYLVSPSGGGAIVKDGDISVFALTPDSPLGKQLLNLEEGEECELNSGGVKINCVVKEVL